MMTTRSMIDEGNNSGQLHAPDGPSVPSTAVCPCCERGSGPVELSFSFADKGFSLRRCGGCYSLFYDPPPQLDYEHHTDSEYAIRTYLELNCSIDILAANVLTGLSGMKPGRLLDLGCGYGFSADIARRLAGWDVTGVEPSAYGRRGSAALGFRLIDGYVTAQHALAKERFDAIFLSEVIEHIHKPRPFLGFLRTMLNPGGRIIMSTPDEAALSEDRSESERLAALSPGAHVALFSKNAIAALLRKIGLHYYLMNRPQGVSFLAVASGAPVRLSTFDGIAAAAKYIDQVLSVPLNDPVLERGLKFRRFRYLIDQNRMIDALAIDPTFGDAPAIGAAPSTSLEFLDRYFAYDPLLLYYRGILRRNFKDTTAGDFLVKAHELACMRIAVAPAEAVVEADFLWRALFAAANSYRETGQAAKANAIFRELLTPIRRSLPGVPSDIRAEAARALAT
jgi:2-polyprenyl-3-methyl-5-hydroxy-6-metoxy-1,4-benzoquinol methylase